MSKIVFFSIPAYGHTNPTIAVVKELCSRGNEVWYYSFDEFKQKIEEAGAKYIRCDDYLPELKQKDEKKIGKDFSALIEMLADVTLSLDKKVCSELKEFKPDCIVSDSICFWGKLFAQKLNIKYICSTTTFSFNGYTAKMIKHKFSETINMILGMKKVNSKLKLLRSNGFQANDVVSLIKNDNETDTIVYTTKEFQPKSETFSDKFYFIGPSISDFKVECRKKTRPQIYISLGTVNNKKFKFYENCVKAFRNTEFDVVMSVGSNTNISKFGEISDNFIIKHSVNQIEVLQNTDVFISHCGMNSVNESLYYGVPMVLFPQQSEQEMVARRVSEIGAGIMLESQNPESIKKTVMKIINEENYRNNAIIISESFRKSGGANMAADVIEKLCTYKD